MSASGLRARAIVAALSAGGVRHVVYCPGSRDAPFAYALAAAEAAGALRVHVRIDERSAGFFALGLARGSETAGREASPVAIVTTSGSAPAHLTPALAEAAHTCVPLIAVSADRPAALRGTGASQTTDHVALLAGIVRGSWDIAAGDGVWATRRALEVATGGALPGGPVHLNVQLAPPLLDDEPASLSDLPEDPSQAGVTERLASARSLARLVPLAPATTTAPSMAALGLDPAAPGVIVAGNQAHLSVGGERIAALARALAWPLLAEPASGVRGEGALTHYQQLLADHPAWAAEARQVLVIGHPTLSRPVTALLTDPTRRVVAVARAGTYTNLGDNVAAVAPAVPLPPPAPDPAVAAWTRRWHAADRALTPADLREHLAAVLWERHGAPHPGILVVGASLAIRALDRAGLASATAPPVLTNRGLAGIDGTVSFARGVHAATGQPVRVLLGDVTFLHDVGGLATGLTEPDDEDVQIVVLNDAGGQIFRTLEYGRDAATTDYRRYFATPQRAALPALAAGFGWDYTYVSRLDEVDRVAAAPIRGRSIVEVDLT